MPIILIFRRLRQENHHFEARLGSTKFQANPNCIVKASFKKQNTVNPTSAR